LKGAAMQVKLYQITSKTDSRKIAEFLSKGGQLLLPFLDMICNTEKAVDELIDVVDKRFKRVMSYQQLRMLEAKLRELAEEERIDGKSQGA
jgi:hypothetical protein